MAELTVTQAPQHQIDPALLAGFGKTVPTAGALHDLAIKLPLGRLATPWLELGTGHTPFSDPHVYRPIPSGTPSPLSYSSIDLCRVMHFGTAVLNSPMGLTLTAEPKSQRLIFLAGAEPNYALEPSTSVQEPRVGRDDAREALRKVLDWTHTTPAELAPVIGASRRTVYNWLARGTIGARPASRIAKLCAVVELLAGTRDPLLIRSWLFLGDPSPADLAAEERWDELEQLIAAQLRPLEAAEVTEESEELPLNSDALKAALVAFATTPAHTSPRRAGWYPREVTGIELDNEVDELSDH